MSSHRSEKQGTTVLITSVGVREQKPRPVSTVCGLRRRTCLIVTVIGILLLVGLGLGVGLGLQAKATTPVSTSTISASPQYSSVAASSSLPATQTQTTAQSTTSIAPATSGTASTTCPGTNGTTYTSSGHSFLLLCQNDIQSSTKVDLGRHYKPSFTDCIDSCAVLNTADNRSDISAVYWVNYDATQTGTCWCFGNTSRSDGAQVSVWAANNLAWIQS